MMEEVKVKRGRGRPRKIVDCNVPIVEKRPRGRPKKVVDFESMGKVKRENPTNNVNDNVIKAKREVVNNIKDESSKNKINSKVKKERTKKVLSDSDSWESPKKPKKIKKIKQTFIEDDAGYVTNVVTFRFLKTDDTFEDFIKKYDCDITFGKNKIGKKTKFDNKLYKITDVITNEKNLTFVLDYLSD